MQNGSIVRSERQRGPDVWEYRWREPGADGKRKHRRMVVGPVTQFRDKDSVMRTTTALRRDINMANVRGKGKPITLSQLADHYCQRELAPNNRWKTHSTIDRTLRDLQALVAFDFFFGGGGAETIVVDGSDQPAQGGTLLSVKAEAPDTWIVERKQSCRLLLKATWKLSNDDSTLTDYYCEFESDGSTFSMDYVYERTGRGSGFAADWQSIKETMNSPLLMQVNEFQGDGLSFVTPSRHETKNVKFDGKDYPNEGPNADKVTSSIRRVDDRTLVITDKYDGKVVETQEIRLSTDLKTLTMTVHFAIRDKKPNVMVFARK